MTVGEGGDASAAGGEIPVLVPFGVSEVAREGIVAGGDELAAGKMGITVSFGVDISESLWCYVDGGLCCSFWKENRAVNKEIEGVNDRRK